VVVQPAVEGGVVILPAVVASYHALSCTDETSSLVVEVPW
jgi:hypothetical protein